ncbi:hypothetical protein [Streptomyces sp. gCLA4]|uniref:hypothetical protein n=1 Tax=Streptomyces sp. gCLA4 TaxID=1873416 RepID=UPI0015FED2A2|nr:hypothetical protein [Streptomyces sp. gCLA4]
MELHPEGLPEEDPETLRWLNAAVFHGIGPPPGPRVTVVEAEERPAHRRLP